jgi:hypothetical protein
MKTSYIQIIILLLFFLNNGYTQSNDKKNNKTTKLVLPLSISEKKYEGFSLKIPSGWDIFQYGQCSELSFICRNPNNAQYSFFFYGVGGYCYLNSQQKKIDDNYVAMGGIKSPLIGSPVISPFTPENFLSNYSLIRDAAFSKQINIVLPEIYNVQIISSNSIHSPMNNPLAKSSLIRAVYSDKTKSYVSEGLFLLTTVPIQLAAYGPSANLGIVFSFIGITAPLGQLETMMSPAGNCLSSFNIEENYLNNCIRISDSRTQSTLQVGRTLATISDGIMKSWENRSRTNDIISQKRSDQILGRDRLYDPVNGKVYEVDNNFIEKYLTNPEKYNLSNLQKLPPNDYDLWNKPTLNGNNIKIISSN